MGQKEKIMEVYFEEEKKFTIRELSAKTKIPKSSVQRIVFDLKKDKILSKDNEIIDSNIFRRKKINFYVERIVGSGLLDFLISELNPSVIILFGSISKGDSVKNSDIDIFIESFVNKELDLGKFERILKHNLQLFVESNIKNLQKHLFNNVVNGIKLYGSLKLK